MDRVLDRLLRQAQGCAKLGVAALTMFTGLQILELIEKTRLTAGRVILPQPLRCLGHHRLGPAPFESLFGRQWIRWFDGVSFLGVERIQAYDHRGATALLRSGPITLIGHEMLQKGQQERTKLALAVAQVTEEIPFLQMSKEALGEILGIGRLMAFAAKVRIDGRPVGLTQRAQGLGSVL